MGYNIYRKLNKGDKKMKNKIEIAEKRYSEMEARKSRFMKKYAETGNKLNLELANIEIENMNHLIVAIMKAKEEEIKMKNFTQQQLKARIETINTLISVFGDDDGKLAKELNDVYKELKKIKKQERMEKLEREEKAAAEAFEKWMKENPEEYEEYCKYHEYLDNQYTKERYPELFKK